MKPDPAAAALATWRVARCEQMDAECRIEHVRQHGPRSKLIELLALHQQLEIRAALLLAQAVKAGLVSSDDRSKNEKLTSTRLGTA
jgi:hypothetical protein